MCSNAGCSGILRTVQYMTIVAAMILLFLEWRKRITACTEYIICRVQQKKNCTRIIVFLATNIHVLYVHTSRILHLHHARIRMQIAVHCSQFLLSRHTNRTVRSENNLSATQPRFPWRSLVALALLFLRMLRAVTGRDHAPRSVRPATTETSLPELIFPGSINDAGG